jgi:hypothetical protein
MSTNQKHPIFLKSLLGVAFILSFGLYLIFRGVKEKEDFIHSKGEVTYYADTFPGISRPNDKYKYLIVNSYDRLFELFVSENQTERYIFKYREIKLGDTIDLYFDENSFAADQRTNKGMRFIDKNGETVFLVNPNDKIAGICFFGAGISILVLLIILKHKGKIL